MDKIGDYIIAGERVKDPNYKDLTNKQKLAWEKKRREEILGVEGYMPFHQEGNYIVIAHGPDSYYGTGERMNLFKFNTAEEASAKQTELAAMRNDKGEQVYHGYGDRTTEGDYDVVEGSLPNKYAIHGNVDKIAGYLDRKALDRLYDSISEGKDWAELNKQQQDDLKLIIAERNKVMVGDK
ncbi:MAG: hypothetical protein ACHP6H_07095, partial [Legionellales bacterium]